MATQVQAKMDARDIVIYVNGINGRSGTLRGTPKAVKFGLATQVQANVYAPNGTVWLRQNGDCTGAFLGKWVVLGRGAAVAHLSQWSEGSGGSASTGPGHLASLVSWPISNSLQPSTETQTPTDMPTPTSTATSTPTPTATATSTSTSTATASATSTASASAAPSDTPTPTTTPVAQYYSVVIDYTYDPLQRLTAADYSTGEFFHYSYDPVGNRLTQDTLAGTNLYTYDIANRLIDVDGISYSWDANGNLLDDGASTYAYDHANRLSSAEVGPDSFSYSYNGSGDRLQQIVNTDATNYTVDLNMGLTQVLAGGSNTYLYGLGRIGEQQPGGSQYHIPDALDSVRQVANAIARQTLTQSFAPYGSSFADFGTGHTSFGFAGEWRDRTDLIHLRARFYDSTVGRFISADPANGTSLYPQSLQRWNYGLANPINVTDPSGLQPYCLGLSSGTFQILSLLGVCSDPFQSLASNLLQNGGIINNRAILSLGDPARIPKSKVICGEGYTLNASTCVPAAITFSLEDCREELPLPLFSLHFSFNRNRACANALAEIRAALAAVKLRHREWELNWYEWDDEERKTHRRSYDQEQRRLRNALDKWDRLNCPDDLPEDVRDAGDWRDKPLP